MATPSRNPITNLFSTWKQHWASLAISAAITLIALAVYYATFMGERPMPVFDFIQRLEFSSIDARFQLRGKIPIDPRIVIVDIDQHSQEVLGRWPFPRIHFADAVNALHDDGARIAAFDMTFSKADQTILPLQDLSSEFAARAKKGKPVAPDVQKTLAEKEAEYSYDQKFADAISHFGGVVLGNYFLYSETDLQGVSPQALDEYANLMAFFPFPQVRPLPSAEPGDLGRVQLIDKYADLGLLPRGAEANAQIFTAAVSSEKGGCGFFNVILDPDTVVRRVYLAVPYGRDKDRANWDIYASLDVQAVRLYLGLSNDVTILNYGAAGVATIEFGPKLIVHPDGVGRLLVNYHGPARTYPYVSFADVATKKFPPGTFKDKIVLMGASATGIGDTRATPFGGLDFPGAEIHANVIDNILNQQFLVRSGPQVVTDIGLILLFGIPLGMWLAVVQPKWMPLGIALLIPFCALNYFAFVHGWWLNFIVPALFTLIPNVSLVALYRVLVEEREKRRVRGAFQQYVSPEVIRRLLTDPKRVQPRKTDVTILFSDIRGFTTISEALDAQELAELLNGYLTEMTRIIFRNQGTLDKYIGDAVMAIWGAPFDEPNHATRCCNAAVAMLARLADLQISWREQKKPVLEIGIGINTGIASVGNMGSSLRYGYTAMGDAVNLSARLEGLNKEYGTRILASEFTRAEVTDENIVFRELDLIRVQGKLQPVTLFEVLASDVLDNGGREMVTLFEKGREAYKRQAWSEARRHFEKVLERWSEDGPSRVFAARCSEYLTQAPPTNWDGVYVMTHK
ncbi:MAG: adenylate/guanylate cyclase domain-containing protein [Candidatus Acidiferrales bacterium]